MTPQTPSTVDKPSEWTLITDLRNHLQSSFDVPSSVLSVIATRLEEVVAGASKNELTALASELGSVLREALRKAPREASDAALFEGQPSETVLAAHLLGQLGFAQLVAAQAASRRADDDFLDIIYSTTFRRYVEALYEEDLCNKDLAVTFNQSEENVSRNLRVLREKGIVDFHRRGREVINFLTPAARQIATAMHTPDEAVEATAAPGTSRLRESGYSLKTSQKVQEEVARTPASMHTQITLGIEKKELEPA